MTHYLVDDFINKIQDDSELSDCIAYQQTQLERVPEFGPWPPEIQPSLVKSLNQNGINELYLHQRQAWDLVGEGKNVVIATGTASGKTLCYNLPIINQILMSKAIKALYIFPTKALAHDQKDELLTIALRLTPRPVIGVYDGDTPTSQRKSVRENAQIIITNPDMLHTGILPHHTNWAQFFSGLRFVVLDEIHTYRGVFGSHISNVIRRLKRVSAFYGSFPQFILTSATIGNPVQHANRLIEEDLELIDKDHSGKGTKYFLMVNPPIVDANLGIRKSAFSQCLELTKDLVKDKIQTIVFARSRKAIEQFIREAKQQQPAFQTQIRGYRSGYLPRDRRQIETELRNGQALLVAATNALELGIDIGGLSAVLMMGYPGTIASLRQQSGRAGRNEDSSMAVFVASPAPIDQFLVRHPEFLSDHSPENALIDPDNYLILLSHIRCAAFELPFRKEESFGNLNRNLLNDFLQFLFEQGVLIQRNDQFFWMADQYPASDISLRSASADVIALQEEENGQFHLIGQIDFSSSLWMVHPGAVYLHEGESYEVMKLDLERKIAVISQHPTDFYTEPIVSLSFSKITELDTANARLHDRIFGEILVTSQVKGFRRLLWGSKQVVDESPLDLPASELRTTACWWVILPELIAKLEEKNLWRDSINNYGSNWDRIRRLILLRDKMTCQSCGLPMSTSTPLHVHHIQPFKSFSDPQEANRLENLISLCPSCHQKAEAAVKLRSGMAGLTYSIQQISSIFAMCDPRDLGATHDPQSSLTEKQPTIILYDQAPAGIGLSRKVFDLSSEILTYVRELILNCPCIDGCPSCVGPAGENGLGAKQETLSLTELLLAP